MLVVVSIISNISRGICSKRAEIQGLFDFKLTFRGDKDRAGPCRLCGGAYKARHEVPNALLFRVQFFKKVCTFMYKVQDLLSSRWSLDCNVDVRAVFLFLCLGKWKYLSPLHFYKVCKQNYRKRLGKTLPLLHILETKWHQILIKVRSRIW